MKFGSVDLVKCPQCGSRLASVFDENTGLAWWVCPIENHYARLQSTDKCPECGGRIVLAESELVCNLCGRVVEEDLFDDSLSFDPLLREKGNLIMTELALGHGDMVEIASKNDLAGRPGTPDFDNRNLGTWTSNRQIRAALGLATRLNEKGQFEIVLEGDQRKAYVAQIKRGGKAAIIRRSMLTTKRFNRELVYLRDEKLDSKKHLIVLGQERFDAYVRRRGGKVVVYVGRSMRSAKRQIVRHEAVCRNRFCQRRFVTQDRRVKYCRKSCRLAEQAIRHRKAQSDYMARKYSKRPSENKPNSRR